MGIFDRNPYGALSSPLTMAPSGGGGGGTPGGSNKQIQYNNSGAFGGIPSMTFDGTNIDFGTRPSLIGSASPFNIWGVTGTNSFVVGSNTGGTDGAFVVKPQIGYVDLIGAQSDLGATQDMHLQALGSDLYLGAALLKWPNTDGGTGQVLTTDGSGVLSFSTPGSQWTTSGSNIYYTTGKVFVGATSGDPSASIFQVINPVSDNYIASFHGASGTGSGMVFLTHAAATGCDIQGVTAVTLAAAQPLNFNPSGGNLFFGKSDNSAAITLYGTVTVATGASGTFTTVDSKTVTVSGGIITSIV
jgi:hypothetical protein